jgi:hypothetical protein
MKITFVFLLIILLSSAALGSMHLISATSSVNSTASSTALMQPTYAVPGNHSAHKVDYWWISNVNKDDLVLLSVQTDAWPYWNSQLSYSNLTLIEAKSEIGTHIYEFIANKTDNYLLRLYADFSFNYTIECAHPISQQVPPQPTVTRFSLTPNPVVAGQTVTLLGNLTTDVGIPISGQQVTIKSNGTSVAILITNSTGWFKASGQIEYAGTYNVTIVYAGSSQYLPSSNWTMLTVSKAQTEIYAKFFPNVASPGTTVTLRGILIDQFSSPIKSAVINLQYSSNYGTTWTPLGTMSTSSYGVFSKTFTAPSIGTYIFRMSYTGSSGHMASTTDITLIVR